MNNSTTGGYLRPTSTSGFPRNLTLNQFIQTVLVGISGLPGTLVRPKWQVAPPQQPDLCVNWMAFGYPKITPDANNYVAMDSDGDTFSIRHEDIELSCSFYGPEAMENATLLRDGFNLSQNVAALNAANMGYKDVGPAFHVPDLVNERFINRIEMAVYLKREVQRFYPILNFLSSNGVINTQTALGDYLLDWNTNNVET